MKIGTLEATRGSIVNGIIETSRRYDDTIVGIPLIIVNGKSKGPIVSVVTGLHGDEYVGSEVVRKLIEDIDPKEFNGTLLVVPTANVPAFEVGSRTGFFDYMDMNRIFPGRAEGHLTEMIAHKLIQEIVSPSEYCIDFHSPGTFLSATPSVNYREVAGDLGVKTMELAESIGIEYLWHYERPGSLSDEAMNKGISSIVIDYIGSDRMIKNDDVTFGVKCLKNAAIKLGMIKGNLDLPEKVKYLLGRTLSDNQMYSHNGGFFRPNVVPGQSVEKDYLLGTIFNVFGETLEQIFCPHDDSVVIAVRTYPSIRPGDWCVFAPRIVSTKTIKG